IVLATADGHGTNAIMRRTGKSKPCVWRWQERYIEAGIAGVLPGQSRASRQPPLPEESKLAVPTKTANEGPGKPTPRSPAAMAAEMGISPSSVGRIWAEAGLKPHLDLARPSSTSTLLHQIANLERCNTNSEAS